MIDKAVLESYVESKNSIVFRMDYMKSVVKLLNCSTALNAIFIWNNASGKFLVKVIQIIF